MATGLLELSGHIALSQLAPQGSSDADTTKIQVSTSNGAFRFRADPGAPWQVTRAFEGATVKGRVSKPAVDAKGRVTVRLQGIDAPELHYRPSAVLEKGQQSEDQRTKYLRWNLDFRQPFAETATRELRAFLESFGEDPLPCVVRSYVDKPPDVFDTYGRFVGDIYVDIDADERSINTWLVEQGWAVPAFYNSMSDTEIQTLIDAAARAFENDAGIWPWLADNALEFDWNLQYRRKATTPDPDEGLVVLPKLFRRVATWMVNRRAKMFTGNFTKFLEAQGDPCFLTEDFLDQGPAATQRELVEFVETDGGILIWPEDLVFRDAPSRLVGAAGDDVEW
jgi:endonuclease YncB( thermonuclease family)